MRVRPVLIDTLVEAYRQRLHAVWLTWAIAALALAPVARDFALGAQARVAADAVLGSAWLLTGAIAIFSGIALARLNQTDDLLIARGLSAHTLLLARTVGAGIVLSLWVFGTVGVYCATAWVWSLPLSVGALTWGGLIWLEALVLLSVSTCLATLVSPLPAASAAVALWWVGHMADETAALAAAGETAMPWLYAILPDLDRFNGHTPLVRGQPMSAAALLRALWVASAWIVATLVVALWMTPNPPRHTQPP